MEASLAVVFGVRLTFWVYWQKREAHDEQALSTPAREVLCFSSASLLIDGIDTGVSTSEDAEFQAPVPGYYEASCARAAMTS